MQPRPICFSRLLPIVLACLALCFPAFAVAAGCEAAEWQSTHAGLQEARRAITADRRPEIHNRANCARAIWKAVNAPDTDCSECVLEYARLLEDVSTLFRRGYEQANGRDVRRNYLAGEFEVRRDLNDFLAATAGDVRLEKAARRNLADAGSCSELLSKLDPKSKKALEFHQLAVSVERTDLLGPQSLRSWVKAVRSCDNWDVATGESRPDSGIREALCAPACLVYLKQYAERVNPQPAYLPYVPLPHACSEGATP